MMKYNNMYLWPESKPEFEAGKAVGTDINFKMLTYWESFYWIQVRYNIIVKSRSITYTCITTEIVYCTTITEIQLGARPRCQNKKPQFWDEMIWFYGVCFYCGISIVACFRGGEDDSPCQEFPDKSSKYSNKSQLN